MAKARRTKQPPDFPSFPLYADPIYISLTPKQQAFLFEWFLKPITGKSNRACYEAAFGEKTNKNTAEAGSSALIHKHKKMKHCIAKLAEFNFKKMQISKQQILNEEKTIAFSDIAEFFDDDKCLIKNPVDLPEHVRKAIASITEITDKQGNVRHTIKLWSKSESLKRLQKMKGMEAPSKMEVTGPDGGPLQVKTNNDYDFTNLSDDELIQFKHLLKKARM